MKRILLILAMAGALFAQPLAVPVTIADITGDGSAHAITTSGSARWVIFICPSTNSAAVRIGDSSISATQGAPVAAGGGLMFPAIPPDPRQATQNQLYDLTKIYYRAGTGDKVSIIYVK